MTSKKIVICENIMNDFFLFSKDESFQMNWISGPIIQNYYVYKFELCKNHVHKKYCFTYLENRDSGAVYRIAFNNKTELREFLEKFLSFLNN